MKSILARSAVLVSAEEIDLDFPDMSILKPFMIEVIYAGLALIFLGTWLIAKWELYWGLHYFSDLFLHEQISKSFFLGRGLFFDNIFAPQSYIHNYFFLLGLAPFTFGMGAFGLVFAHWSILSVTVIAVIFTMRGRSTNRLCVLTLLLGPISFWIFDDPNYGFHTESLFFPLGILLALTLLHQSRVFYLVAVLIVLNREDGALIGCAIHCLYVLMGAPLTKEMVIRVLKVCAVWALIFLWGIIILKVFGAGARERQDYALEMLQMIFSDPEIFRSFVTMVKCSFLLLFSSILLLVLCCSRRLIYALPVVGTPILAIIIVASCPYLPNIVDFEYHGTSWPYRFGLLWVLVASAILFAPITKLGKYSILVLVFCCGSLWWQHQYLIKIRNYNVVQRVFSESHPVAELSVGESAILHCLRKQLPDMTPLIVSGSFVAFFSKFDWSFGKNSEHAWKPSELIVCDEGKFPFDYGCREAYEEKSEELWIKTKVEGIMIAYNRNSGAQLKVVASCVEEHAIV